MTEKALFPMKTMRITQGMFSNSSHKKSLAIDNGGSDYGIDKVFAPFSGTVTRIRNKFNEMWITSDAPVEWADGTVDFMTCLFIHADNIPIANGAHFKQGDWIYNEGSKGHVTGAHLHLEVARGKFVDPYGWFDSGETYTRDGATYSIWKLYNQVKPNAAFFVNDSIKIVNPGTDGTTGKQMVWVDAKNKVSGSKLPANTFFTPTVKNMQFMYTPDVNDCVSDKIAKGAYLPVDKTFHAYEQASAGGFTWWKFRYTDGKLYWAAMIDGRYTKETAAFNTSDKVRITIGNQNQETYTSMDMHDVSDKVLHAGSTIEVSGVSVKKYYNTTWYLIKDGIDYYVPSGSNVSTNIDDGNWKKMPANFVFTPLASNVQIFNTPNVNDAVSDSIAKGSYLTKNAHYPVLEESNKEINGFFWYKIVYTNDKVYYAAKEDASKSTVGPKTEEAPTVQPSKPVGPHGDYKTKLTGIDVAKFQGTVNWNSVKRDSKNIRFSFVRVVSTNNSGLYVDPQFVKNVKNALAQGIPVGSYIYTYAVTKERVNQEIDLAVRQCQSYKMGYPMAWDVEDKKLPANLNRAQLTDLCIYALNRIKRLGFYPMLYTYTSFANAYLDMKRIDAAGFDVWIADYRGYCGYKGKHTIWQYSSSGSVSGISGRVDMDTSYWDYARYISDLGLNGFSGSGAAVIYPSTALNGYHITTNKGNVQYFTYPSIYDENCGYLEKGRDYKVISKLDKEYDGYTFYIIEYKGSHVYVAYVSDGRMSLVQDTPPEFNVPYPHTVYAEKDMVLEDLDGHVQIFSKPDVNDSNCSYLGAHRTCRVYAKLTNSYTNFNFYAVVISNEIKYVAITNQFITYNGQPYQRTPITDNTVFQVLKSGAYATHYPSKVSQKVDLTVGAKYSLCAKLNRTYDDYSWYVISVDGLDLYAPEIADVVHIGDPIIPEEKDVDKFLRIFPSNDTNAYIIPNTASNSVEIPVGTVITPNGITAEEFQGMHWYIVTLNSEKMYIPENDNLNIYYDYPMIPVEKCFCMIPKEEVRSYERASLSANFITINNRICLVNKVDEIIEGVTWYTYQDAEGNTRFVNDSENAVFKYDYVVKPASPYTFINVTGEDYKVYDHITNVNGLSVPVGTLIPIEFAEDDPLISEDWYIGKYNGQTVYCEDNANAEIIHKYTEAEFDHHLGITTLNETKGYLYASMDCAATSLIPAHISFKPSAKVDTSEYDGLHWYRIEWNNATLYLPENDPNLRITNEYSGTIGIEGEYLTVNQPVTAYTDPIDMREDTSITLEAGNIYTVAGHLSEVIHNSNWLVINANDQVYYVQQTAATSIIYKYGASACDNIKFEVLKSNFAVYANPIDMEVIELIQKGMYPAIAKLDKPYGDKTWYIIQLNGHEVYAPLEDAVVHGPEKRKSLLQIILENVIYCVKTIVKTLVKGFLGIFRRK